MNTIKLIAFLLLCPLLVSGCGVSTRAPSGTIYFETGVRLEQDKKPVEARKQYLLALAADPSNKAAADRLESLEAALEANAQKHYEQSLELKKKGKYADAEQHLKMALKLWPEHDPARKDLVAARHVNIRNYFRHTIRKGESLSLISNLYYGTTHLSDLLARVNRIKDAAKIKVGMKLKIPQLENYPFVHQKAMPSTPPSQQIHPNRATAAESSLTDTYRGLGIKFFDTNQFENAVLEFKKVLKIAPDDKPSKKYLSRAYGQLGSEAFDSRRYLDAIEYYQNALAHDTTGCAHCKQGIKTSQDHYKEKHYKSGMKYFDAQDLARAVLEWNRVFRMDPGYKRTAELLEKARTIQKNVEAIKQNQ